MSLIQDYRNGKLNGTLSKEQTLDILNEVKSLSPSLIEFINALDSGNDSPEETEQESNEKSDILRACSEIINHICRLHVLAEYPHHNKKVNEFCLRISINVTDLSQLGSSIIRDNFYLLFGDQKVKVCEATSFYKIVRDILTSDSSNDDELGIFLYYLMVKNDRDSFISIRSLYLLDKYLKMGSG